MRTMKSREWSRWYELVFRQPFVNLTPEQRGKLVRGCKGKAIYRGFREAWKIADSLPQRECLYAGAYNCPLCGGIHVGNSKTRNIFREGKFKTRLL